MTSSVKRIAAGAVAGLLLLSGAGLVARAIAAADGRQTVSEQAPSLPDVSRGIGSAKPSLPPGQVPPGQESNRDALLAHFQKNKKGQYYGKMADGAELGIMPDLIQARATNGRVGYVLVNELDALGESQEPADIPVWDADMENMLGHYRFSGAPRP